MPTPATPDNVNGIGDEPNRPATEAAPTPEATPAPQPQAAPPASPAQTALPKKPPNVVPIPAERFAQMRKEEREKGKKQLRADLDARAKKLGYESHDQMLQALETQPSTRTTPMAQQPQRPQQQQPSNNDRRNRRRGGRNRNHQPHDQVALDAERQRLTRQLNAETRKRREAERARDRAEAESKLREAAARAGVKDVDYALHLIRKDPKVASATREQREAFDEEAYFNGLRDSHPMLFGVERQPANTAPAPAAKPPEVSATPAPPLAPHVPTEPAPPNGKGNHKDARELTNEQFKDRLRQLGVNPDAPS